MTIGAGLRSFFLFTVSVSETTLGRHWFNNRGVNYIAMKRLIALTVLALASQAVAIFAGEPVVSSKQVIAPPPLPPPEFFRPNEFDIGAFGTYATGVGSGENAGKLH